MSARWPEERDEGGDSTLRSKLVGIWGYRDRGEDISIIFIVRLGGCQQRRFLVMNYVQESWNSF